MRCSLVSVDGYNELTFFFYSLSIVWGFRWRDNFPRPSSGDDGHPPAGRRSLVVVGVLLPPFLSVAERDGYRPDAAGGGGARAAPRPTARAEPQQDADEAGHAVDGGARRGAARQPGADAEDSVRIVRSSNTFVI